MILKTDMMLVRTCVQFTNISPSTTTVRLIIVFKKPCKLLWVFELDYALLCIFSLFIIFEF